MFFQTKFILQDVIVLYIRYQKHNLQMYQSGTKSGNFEKNIEYILVELRFLCVDYAIQSISKVFNPILPMPEDGMALQAQRAYLF